MKEHSKRWLLSMMKTSGSKRRYLQNGRHADDRAASKKATNMDMLPQRERIRSTSQFYNGKVNYGLLLRFLRTQTGRDWNEVYAEVIARIPTRLLDYKDMIYWFVADKVELIDQKIWNKRTQKFIRTGEEHDFSKDRKEFYVDPQTNILVRIKQFPKN